MSVGAGFTVRPTGSLKGGQTMWKRGMATWKTSSLLAAGGTDSQKGWCPQGTAGGITAQWFIKESHGVTKEEPALR